jgi:hypothetical protein
MSQLVPPIHNSNNTYNLISQAIDEHNYPQLYAYSTHVLDLNRIDEQMIGQINGNLDLVKKKEVLKVIYSTIPRCLKASLDALSQCLESNMELKEQSYGNCPVEGAKSTMLFLLLFSKAVRLEQQNALASLHWIIDGRWQMKDFMTFAKVTRFEHYILKTSIRTFDDTFANAC